MSLVKQQASSDVLGWVNVGNPTGAKVEIKKVDVEFIDEAETFRLRQPPYPGIEELIESLKVMGQTTPVFVRPKGNARYELISGYRRFAALKKMGAPQAIVRVFSDITDEDGYALAISENVDRGEMTDWERARACVRLTAQGRTQEEVAHIFHWSAPKMVRNHIRVAEQAPEPVAKALQARQIQLTHALALARLGEVPFSAEDAARITNEAVKRKLSVRAIQDLLEREAKRETPPLISIDSETDGSIRGVRVQKFKSGALQLSARVDPARPEEFDTIADELRKVLRLIQKYRRQVNGEPESETPERSQEEIAT